MLRAKGGKCTLLVRFPDPQAISKSKPGQSDGSIAGAEGVAGGVLVTKRQPTQDEVLAVSRSWLEIQAWKLHAMQVAQR